MLTTKWTKATASNSGGNCVQARRTSGGVEVSDSKEPAGPVLSYTDAEWTAFLDGARKGEFDLSTV